MKNILIKSIDPQLAVRNPNRTILLNPSKLKFNKLNIRRLKAVMKKGGKMDPFSHFKCKPGANFLCINPGQKDVKKN